MKFEKGNSFSIDHKGNLTTETGHPSLLDLYIPTDEGLKPDSVVGKTRQDREQVIIGPIKPVMWLAQGYEILDILELSHMHQMDIIITQTVNEARQYTDFPEGPTFSDDLINRFGIRDRTRGSRFKSPIKEIGVKPDIRRPLLRIDDLVLRSRNYNNFGPIVAAMYIVHEWTHHEQAVESLPITSLWSERAALTKQAIFLYRLINSGRLTNEIEKNVFWYLKYYSELIANYRNARNYRNHLFNDAENSDGTPIKNQTLHIEDFSFGY